MPCAFTDTWKANYRGELVCIKAIRADKRSRLRKVQNVGRSFLSSKPYSACTNQTFHHKINALKFVSHPNLLPIIEVSETLFPLCIMSPWMPDGNVIQYTQTNPSANRLMLVCAHQPEAR
jgi:hypothetical protein